MKENTRTQISIHFTKILVLFGRLTPEYNPRQLPLTYHLVLIHMRELEQLQKNNDDFDALFRESVEIRAHYTKVFVIPFALLSDPSLEGLKRVTAELVNPLIPRYCEEERKALSSEVDSTRDAGDVMLMLKRTLENCRLLQGIAQPEAVKQLQALKGWCQVGLDRLQ
jgi:hypothetical protein